MIIPPFQLINNARLFLAIFCLISFLSLEAQKWCPPGATWYYTHQYSYPILEYYIKMEYVKDTLVNQKECKKINESTVYSKGSFYSIYTYNSGDTVYILTNEVFQPHFYFN